MRVDDIIDALTSSSSAWRDYDTWSSYVDQHGWGNMRFVQTEPGHLYVNGYEVCSPWISEIRVSGEPIAYERPTREAPESAWDDAPELDAYLNSIPIKEI